MWNISTLTSQRYISAMHNVQLPVLIDTPEKMNALCQKLVDEDNIFLPIFEFD